MSSFNAKVGEKFLAHYASKYYDPVKAHQYYEEHKKLSDKAAKTALTSSKQREIFAVSQENIAKAKTAEATKLSTNSKARIEQLKTTAKQKADAIASTLDSLARQLKFDTKNVQLNTIPKNATPKQRAFLEKQNNIIRARTAKENNQKYRDASGQASRDRAKVVSDLSSAIQDARTSYSQAMTALNTKYVNITAKEKQNIRNQVPGAPAKKAKR